MTNLEMGYLFKKKYIDFNKEKYEVFEFIDYVVGIVFNNTSNNELCNIISRDYMGTYASIINENKNEGELVFLRDDLKEAIRANDNKVEFE